MQIPQNYSKGFQMTMAKSNSYGNGPTLFEMVRNGLKWSQMVQGLRTKD